MPSEVWRDGQSLMLVDRPTQCGGRDKERTAGISKAADARSSEYHVVDVEYEVALIRWCVVNP